MQQAETTLPYDADALAEEFDGDLALIRRIVQIFLGDYPEQLDILRRALASSDIERLFSIAHSIKGAVAHFGAARATAAALGVETCCRRGDLATIPFRVDELVMAMDELAASLKAGYAAR
jgi:HPt (histidine-containing phosphotransfer) domain-containing protein